MTPFVYSIPEVCENTNSGRTTVYKAINDGHIVAHKYFFRARLQLLAPLPQYRGYPSDPSPVCAVPRFMSSFQAPVSEVQPKVQLLPNPKLHKYAVEKSKNFL